MSFSILDLDPQRADLIEQTAALLHAGFRDWPDAWPDLEAARAEVLESLAEGRISRVMLDDAGGVIGWVGGIPQYDGRVWELHPLVVAEEYRRQGLGRTLVRDLEERVARRGALTLWLGSDDLNEQTSLGGVDLYADLPGALRDLRNLESHPYEFYTRLGFTVVGVMPDANGRGKPDIFLAKRIGS